MDISFCGFCVKQFLNFVALLKRFLPHWSLIFVNHLNNEIQVNWCSTFNKIKFYVWRSRAVMTFNIIRCILDLVNRARPEYASASFALMTTFPNKELTDENQSLADAKLLNAVIVQRMKWLFQYLNLVMNFSSQSYLPLGEI